jgi:formate/nitrite transporter FocA (FNT family)
MQKKFLTPVKIAERFVETEQKKIGSAAVKQAVWGILVGAFMRSAYFVAFRFRNAGEFDLVFLFQ